MSRAERLVADAFATEGKFFEMEEIMDQLETMDFVPDVRIRAENANYQFNYGAMDDASRRGAPKPRVHGIPYALNASFDERIPVLSHAVMDQHRSYPSESLMIIDHQKASDGTALPERNIDDPKQANVMRGLVASDPQQLHILRGGYTHEELARQMWDGEIITGCDVGIARDCDRSASPGGYRDRKIWGMFSTHVGEFLIFHTICSRCFCAMWPIEDEDGFYVFDPSQQNSDFLAWKRGHLAWRRSQHARIASERAARGRNAL